MRCEVGVGPLLAALLGCLVATAAAETVHITDHALPSPGAFEVLQLVYPVGGAVKLGLFAENSKTTLHVGLLPWEHVQDLAGHIFCKADRNLGFHSPALAKNFVSIRVDPGSAANGDGVLWRMAYGVFMANCGGDATGTVTGFLTLEGGVYGHERNVVPIYMISALAFAGVACWWLFTLRAQPERCHSVHWRLMGLAVCSFFEAVCCIAHYVTLHTVNDSDIFQCFGAAFFGTKIYLCLAAFMEAAIRGKDEESTTRHQAIICLGLLGNMPRVFIYIDRHMHLPGLELTFLSTALAVLSSVIVLAFVAKLLVEGIRRATKSEQQEVLDKLQQTGTVLIFWLVASAVVMALDSFDRPEVSPNNWSYHAVAVAAPSQAAFGLGLVFMMHAWRPAGSDFVRAETEIEDGEAGGLNQAQPDDDEEGKPPKPMAETVGASTPAE